MALIRTLSVYMPPTIVDDNAAAMSLLISKSQIRGVPSFATSTFSPLMSLGFARSNDSNDPEFSMNSTKKRGQDFFFAR